MDCERHTHGGCRIHYPLGKVTIATSSIGEPLRALELFISHADPVVGIEPAQLDAEFVDVNVAPSGATVHVLDERRYDLVGYCDVDEALIGVYA